MDKTMARFPPAAEGWSTFPGCSPSTMDNNGRYLSINSSTGGRVDLSNLTSITLLATHARISSDSSAMSLPQLTTAPDNFLESGQRQYA